MFWSNKPPAAAPSSSTRSASISRITHLQSYLNHHVLKPSTRKVSNGELHTAQSINIDTTYDQELCVCILTTSPYLTQYILLGKYDNKLISTHIIDGTIYDTVFQTTNGFALILRVYLPLDPSRAPTMTLHGVRASHNWLDIRMKVIGYTPISTDQRWKSSNLKLGDAVYAVIHHFQLTPRELFQYVF